MTNAALFLAALIAFAARQGGTGNLLINGSASEGTRAWQAHGLATVERFGGVPCFTVRNQGSFSQEVPLAAEAVGMYAVLVGRGQSERINADGSITGLPYLYALAATADRRRFLAYWQGQGMLARPEQPGDWVQMWGVFRVPKDAAYINVQLKQAERKDSPQDGSAARFADVQMHLFPTEARARRFLEQYLGQHVER